MAFAPSAKSGEFHYLVEFSLDSTIFRYAEEDLSVQTSNASGQFYEGRLPQTGQLVRDLGSVVEPRETIQTFSVVLDNRDGQIERNIEDYEWANRNVNIWLGEGVSKTNYSLVFPGFVAHPGGIRWDEDSATITVIDRRVKNRRTLPLNKFDITTYPNVEDKSKEEPIPIVYGDWTSDAQDGVSVPCFCTDMTAINKAFKIADHGIQGLERVLKNAVALTLGTDVVNICLSDSTFELSGVAYAATTDIMSANVSAIQTANGTLMTTGHHVLRDIYTSWMNLTATDLDVTAFNTHAADATEKVRRWIGSDTTTEDLVTELVQETYSDMRFVGGKYSPKYRSLDLAGDRIDIFEADIVADDSEKAQFSVSKDPERFYFNKVRARYNFNPIDVKYSSSYATTIAAAVANVSGEIERQWDLNWMYDQADTEGRVQREIVTFSVEPVFVDFTLTNRILLKNLADQVDLTYNVFDGRSLQIRRMETDLGSMVSRVTATDILQTGFGKWTEDSDPAWSSASEAQKDLQGFWSNGTGHIDPDDPSSFYQSLWF